MLELDDLSPSFVEGVGRSVGNLEGVEENARRQGELEAALSDIVSDVESPFTELDFGNARYVEHALKITGRHISSPAATRTTERLLVTPVSLNGSCPEVGFLPVVFDGMLDRNTPAPCFRIPREFNSLPRAGRAIVSPVGGRPRLSTMEM